MKWTELHRQAADNWKRPTIAMAICVMFLLVSPGPYTTTTASILCVVFWLLSLFASSCETWRRMRWEHILTAAKLRSETPDMVVFSHEAVEELSRLFGARSLERLDLKRMDETP